MRKETSSKLARRIAASALATIMSASMILPAMAATTYAPTIDMTKKGEITLHKIVANNGQNTQGDGHTDSSITNPADTSVTQDNAPLDNIGYSAIKIASWDSVANDFKDDTARDGLDSNANKSTTGRYWVSLNQDIFGQPGNAGTTSILGKLGGTQRYTLFESVVDTGSPEDSADGNEDGKKTQIVYSNADIEDMWEQILASPGTAASENKPGEVMLNEYAKANATTAYKDQKTNANGAVTFANMDLGLYYFAETDITAHDGIDDSTGKAYVVEPWDVLTETQRADFVTNLTTTERSDWDAQVGVKPADSATQAQKDEWENKRKNFYEKYRAKSLGISGETDGINLDDSYYRNPEWPVVETPSKPFLVSMPMTNVSDVTDNSVTPAKTYAPGTIWEYTLDVYPKNQTNNVMKRILDPEDVDAGNTSSATFRVTEDYMMNEIIKQVIWADVPKLQPSYTYDVNGAGLSDLEQPAPTHKTFKIKDTMDIGYHFKSVDQVVLVTKTEEIPSSNSYFTGKTGENKIVLTQGSTNDYTVSGVDGDHEFEITLTEKGLKKLDDITADSQLAVYFSADMDKEACIGTDSRTNPATTSMEDNLTPYTKKGNGNFPTLTWKNSNTLEKQIEGNRIYVYTYQMTVTKTGLTQPELTKFQVRHKAGFNSSDPRLTDTNRYNDELGLVKWIKEADGVYHVYDANGMDSAIAANDTSVVVEVSPAHSGTMILKGFDSKTYEFREVATQSGASLLKSTFDVELKENLTLRDGELTDAVLSIDNASDSLDINKTASGNGGIVTFTIDNVKEIALRTGGEGRVMVFVFAGIGAAVLGIAYVIYKKKQKVA